jgi:methyl-accepting chemotaxis protein
MRNLAQRAKESTVQVGSILGEIQRGINGTVMLTEEAVKRSDSGKQQAEITEQTIHQMTRTTVESVHAFQQIIGATSQQQIGFDQVTQGMRDIRQASEQTAIGTAQLEKALANLNELSLQLRTAVSRYQV